MAMYGVGATKCIVPAKEKSAARSSRDGVRPSPLRAYFETSSAVALFTGYGAGLGNAKIQTSMTIRITTPPNTIL